jgi:hypothetical protein
MATAPARRRSTTRRTARKIAIYLAFAVLFLGLASLLGHSALRTGGFWSWVGTIVCVLIALLLAVSTALRDGPCPACGSENTEIREGSFTPCINRKCQRYLTGNGDQLWLVPDDTVTNAPTFSAVLPERFGWPPGCCVCGQQDTRTVPVTLHVKETGKNLTTSVVGLALGRIVVRTGGGTMVTVNAPHCAQHMDGVALVSPSVGPLRILFRSYQTQQRFRQHNKVAVN